MFATSVALSNLRACVILVVLAFHSVLAYLGSNPADPIPFDKPPYGWLVFPIVDNRRWFGFDLFCALQNVYLMSFMFFLSGLFVWPSLARREPGTFLWRRFVRLGVPAALAVLVLMPMTYYATYRVTAVDPSVVAFARHWFGLPFWPGGPIWFVWQLLALNIAAVVLLRGLPRSVDFLSRLSSSAAAQPGRYCCGLTMASALAYIPLALTFDPWRWVQYGPFAIQLSRPLHYAVYFFAGIGVGAYGLERGLLAADGMLARRWGVWLVGALAAFLLWMAMTALTLQEERATQLGVQVAADLSFVLSCATGSLAFAAVFLRFATRRWRIVDEISDRAYGMYLVHYIFVVWLQYALLDSDLFAPAKAAIVFVATALLSWGTTAAVCRIPLGSRLIGAERPMLVRAP